MKLDKKELMQRVSDLIEDEETKISILEDMEDSIVDEPTTETVVEESAKRELEELKWKYEDLRNRYKERFLKGEEVEEEKKDDETEDEELREEEVIDIKEI